MEETLTQGQTLALALLFAGLFFLSMISGLRNLKGRVEQLERRVFGYKKE